MDKTISPKLKPVELSDGKTQQTVKPGQPMLTAPQALPETGEMKMRLDSVITKDANGNNSMLQYFVYNDKGKEIKREYMCAILPEDGAHPRQHCGRYCHTYFYPPCPTSIRPI